MMLQKFILFSTSDKTSVNLHLFEASFERTRMQSNTFLVVCALFATAVAFPGSYYGKPMSYGGSSYGAKPYEKPSYEAKPYAKQPVYEERPSYKKMEYNMPAMPTYEMKTYQPKPYEQKPAYQAQPYGMPMTYEQKPEHPMAPEEPEPCEGPCEESEDCMPDAPCEEPTTVPPCEEEPCAEDP